MSDSPSRPATAGTNALSDRRQLPLAEIESAVRSIRFGTVQIVIQDGVVVQIDKTEKVRLR
jgi:hypothetical protein